MKTTMKRAATAIVASLALLSFGAEAGGIVLLFNETGAVVHPWFKSNCWGSSIGPQTGWVFFGSVADEFQWSFSDPGLTDPTCPNPVIQFTFTTDLTPPPDELNGDVIARFKFATNKNVVIQIGGKLKAFGLGEDD